MNKEEVNQDIAEEKTIEEKETSETVNKDNKFLSGLKKGVGGIAHGGMKVLSFAKENTVDKAAKAIKDSKAEKELNKFFESKAYTFLIDNITIYGVKGYGDDYIIFRTSDAEHIKMGTEIRFDRQEYKITDFDKKAPFNFMCDGKEYPLSCFKASFKPVDAQAPQTVNYQISNNVSLAEGATFTGDIQQVAQINNELNKIESAINGFKPGLFNKGKKEQDEAKRLFVNFKSSVLGQQPKDKSFFEKFIKILGDIAPAAVAIAKSIW